MPSSLEDEGDDENEGLMLLSSLDRVMMVRIMRIMRIIRMMMMTMTMMMLMMMLVMMMVMVMIMRMMMMTMTMMMPVIVWRRRSSSKVRLSQLNLNHHNSWWKLLGSDDIDSTITMHNSWWELSADIKGSNIRIRIWRRISTITTPGANCQGQMILTDPTSGADNIKGFEPQPSQPLVENLNCQDQDEQADIKGSKFRI